MTGDDGMSVASPASRRDRLRAIQEIVAGEAIANQQELGARLAERGFAVTQATVSRDIAELGLAKGWRGDRHAYVLSADAARGASAPGDARSDERLRRILSEIPVTVARSGLILVVTGSAGTASIIAQAIDESTLTDQVGTVAGDNTLLVLFADESSLRRWQARFDGLLAAVPSPMASTSALPGAVSEVPR